MSASTEAGARGRPDELVRLHRELVHSGMPPGQAADQARRELLVEQVAGQLAAWRSEFRTMRPRSRVPRPPRVRRRRTGPGLRVIGGLAALAVWPATAVADGVEAVVMWGLIALLLFFGAMFVRVLVRSEGLPRQQEAPDRRALYAEHLERLRYAYSTLDGCRPSLFHNVDRMLSDLRHEIAVRENEAARMTPPS